MKKTITIFWLFTLALLCGTAQAQKLVPNTVPNKKAYKSSAIEFKNEVLADTIDVFSAKMNRGIKNVVVKPQCYAYSNDQRFPVLYLLHGAYGCYSDWSKKTDLHAIANMYSFIIVCPDGQDSWYFDSPIDPKMQFETYVSTELVDFIDKNYRTIPVKECRAITGLSMGGHGALWIAWRHPDVFGSCGSMSGGVDITKFPDRWHIQARLGKYETNKQRWTDHAVINLVPKLKPGQNIIIDDGYGDIFYQVNLNLHEALMKQGIDHEFTVRPGKHTWDYWINSLKYHAMFFNDIFTNAINSKKLN